MAKKKDFRTSLFEEIDKNGISSVLMEILGLLSNPNIQATEDDIETATMLRDSIRDIARHRAIMQQPFFKK